MVRLETNLKNAQDDISEVKSDVKGISKAITDLPDVLDKRYAPKWIGTAFMAGCAAILLAFITIAVIDPFKSRLSPQQTVTITTKAPDGTTTTRTVPADTSTQSIPAGPGTTVVTQSTPTPESSSATTSTPQPQQQSTQPKTGLCAVPLIGSLCQ